MHDVAWRGMWIWVRSKDAQKQLARTSLRKSRHKRRHKPNLQSTSKYGFPPDLGGKNGDVLSMRMQVILDSSFARLGSAPTWAGRKESSGTGLRYSVRLTNGTVFSVSLD